jgi:hypothetical protein
MKSGVMPSVLEDAQRAEVPNVERDVVDAPGRW